MTEYTNQNFDLETEGQPPAGLTPDTQPNYAPTTFEVDDAQSYSSPHSVKCERTGDWYGCFRWDYASGILTGDPWLTKVYCQTTTMVISFYSHPNTGNLVGASSAVLIGLKNDGNIEYYTGGSWVDTGYNYSTGWNRFALIHDIEADTFDLIHNDTEIISDGSFRNSVSTIKALHWLISTTGNPDYFWMDDFIVGEESGWQGKCIGVDNPAKVNGNAKEKVQKVNGVNSA